MTDTLTWTRDGLTYTATPPDGETKAKGTKWTTEQARKHPRDSEGKFIETGAEVRILGVGLGRVLSDDAGPGKTAVRLANGQTRNVPNGSLTVTKRPDGSKPTGKPEDLKKPAPVKPAAPRSAPADRTGTGGKYPQISTHGDLRRYWESGGEGNPDLPDGQRDFLRHAAANANDSGLSKGGGLALIQRDEGGPWQISDHHGRKIIGDLPTEERAEELASRLESLADADGNRFDWNGPGFTDRAKAFRTADGETLGVAVQRIFSSGQAGSEGGKGDGGTRPKDPALAEDLAKLRAVAEGEPWKPVKNRNRMQQGRARIKEAAAELADAIEGGAKPHDVIAAFDRFAASTWDASHLKGVSLNSSMNAPGDSTFAGELLAPGRNAYLRWRATAPNGGSPTGRRFRSVEQVRDHLAAGGDKPAVLSYSRQDENGRELAGRLDDDTILAGDGSFVAVRNDKGKWNLHVSANGQALVPRVDFDSRADAAEVADALKAQGNDFWDHPDHWLNSVYPIDEVQEVLAERQQRLDGDSTEGDDEGSGEAPSLPTTSEEVRAYWAQGGTPGQKLPTPDRLRSLAAEVHDLRLSPSKALVLVQDQKGKAWRITNLHGAPLPSEVNQTSLKRAQEMVERIEAIKDADGNGFDWNSPNVADRSYAWRAANGQSIRQALGDAVEAQKKANKPKPEPKPEPKPAIIPPGQAITSVDQVRNHLAAGGDDPDTSVQEAAKRISTAEGLALVAGNSFVIRPLKGAGRTTWTIHHSRTARGAAPNGADFNRQEATAFAERLKTLYDENGQRFDWDAPDVNERLQRIPNRDEQMRAIKDGKQPPIPTPEPSGDKGPEAPRLDTPEAVRAYWESGGEGDERLSSGQRSMMKHAAERNVEIRLSDDGGLVLARQQKSGPWMVLNLRGEPTLGRGVAGLVRARDLARRLERDVVDADGVPLDWNDVDEDRRLAFRTDRGERYEDALDRVYKEHLSASDAAGGKRAQQGITKVGDAAAVRAYWAQGGRAEPDAGRSESEWEDHRQTMRWKAGHVDDLKVSPGGQFILTRSKKGLPWQIATVENFSVPGDFSNEKQAREFAVKLETQVIDADGKPFDWGAPNIGQRTKAFRSPAGETLAEVFSRIQRGEPAPAPRPTPEPAGGKETPEPKPEPGGTGPAQRFDEPGTDLLPHNMSASAIVETIRGIDGNAGNAVDGLLSRLNVEKPDRRSVEKAWPAAHAAITALLDRSRKGESELSGAQADWLQQLDGYISERMRNGGFRMTTDMVDRPGWTAEEFADIYHVQDHLHEMADNLQLPRKEGESSEDYRQRVEARQSYLRALARDKTLMMAPDNRMVARQRGRGDWQIIAPGAVIDLTPSGQTKIGTKEEAFIVSEQFAKLKDADGNPVPWHSRALPDIAQNWRSADGEKLADAAIRILGQNDLDRGRRGTPVAEAWLNRQEERRGEGRSDGGTTPPEPSGGKETPEPKPGPDAASRAGRFATMDEVRDHWRKLAEAPDATEEHANYLRAMADDPERSKKLFLSPGGTLVMNNFDARTVEFTHAASGLSLAGTHGGNRIWSEWGGRKAHLELARRLETRMLDGDGNQLDWSNPDLRELMRTWRSQYGENGLAAAWRIKGEWDHENGKDTIASRDYAMVWENPDRPAATGRSAYGDEVKPGDILSVSQAGRLGVDKRVTAVDPAGWGKYRLTYEDDTSEVVARNERLLRSGLERYVTNADGDVIGENVPVGVLKPGDRVQFTAEGGSTFNVADQTTLKQGGIDGYRSVQVEGTLVGEADPDGRGRTRMVLKGVVVRQGRASVTLPNQQRDREGRATTYAVPASVTRLGKTSASDADRDAARERRLAEEAELDRAVMADRARKRVLSAYRFAVPEVPRIDQGELERRRGELADADRNAVDAAAARLQVMAANVPATLSGPNDNRQAMVAAYAAAISERMEALGYLHPAPNYRLGWETADRLRNRTAGAWERALAGDRLDEDALRGVVDMAAALGNRDLVDAVAAERERRNRQPNPEGLNDEALTAALTAVDEPTGRAAGELLRLLAITDPDETPRPQTVRGWWLDFHEATQRAMQREDISDPTAEWLQRVSDDIADRMRRRHHRPITSENVERLAEYEAMDIEQLRRVLDGMRYESDAYDDLMEELERRGYNDSGYRPYGSPDDLTDGKQPSRELVGTRVALHDGQGGWIEGFLHQRRSGWVLSRSPDDPGASPVGLQDRGNRTAPFVMSVRPGHPALADLNKSEYSLAELDGELNRLAPQIQALWAADRRRGDAEFDRLFARYNELLRERQERPDPDPEPLRQDETLFDETGTPTEDVTPKPEPSGGKETPEPKPGDGAASDRRFADAEQLREHYRALAAEATDPIDKERLATLVDPKTPLILSPGGGLAMYSPKRGVWTMVHADSGLAVGWYGVSSRAEAPEYLERAEKLKGADGKPFPWNATHDEIEPLVNNWRSYRGASFIQEIQQVQREHDLAHGRPSNYPDLDEVLAERAAKAEQERQAAEKLAEKLAAEEAWQANQESSVAAEDRMARKPLPEVAVGDEVVVYGRIGKEIGNALEVIPEGLKSGDLVELRGVAVARYPGDVTSVSLHEVTYRTPDGRSGEFARPGRVVATASVRSKAGDDLQVFTRERQIGRDDETGKPPLPPAKNNPDAGTVADAARDTLDDSQTADAVRGLHEALNDPEAQTEAVTDAWVTADRALKNLMDRLDKEATDQAGWDKAQWVEDVRTALTLRVKKAGHDTPDMAAQERRDRYAAMSDADLRAAVQKRLNADDLDAVEAELERRGFNFDGSPAAGSRHDMADPQRPTDAIVGRHVVVNTPQGQEVMLLERDGDDYYAAKPRVNPNARHSREILRDEDWVDPVHPGDPRLAGLLPEEYSTTELDGELNRLAPQIQALWSADRRRGDAEFDRLFARHGELLKERQGRPDPDPEPIRQDEALFDETGTPTEDATPEEPRGTVVKASTLAVGDRIDAGQVEQVTRIQDMVFATVRDGDDRRTVKGYPPDADVRRLTASGERVPEPVTVADVPSGELRAEDRVLLARHDGRYLPATVTSVADEGDVRVLDVRYDDGSTQTVLVDRGEVLPRLGGPEAGVQPDPADEEEADEPPAEAEPVAAGTLKPGDRFMFNNRLDVYEVMSVDAGGASLGVRVRRERDGAEFDFGLGKTQTVFRAPRPGPQPDGEGDGTGEAEQRPVVKPLPYGTASARPVLYTYQRRNLNWLGLEASQDETVQQAALRVRDRMPLSADQAAALAGAVRAQAATEKPGRQRSMERLAYTLDAAAAQARGLRKPRKPEGRGTPFKARATNLVEGDVVALPGAKGRARVGKVTGKRTLMGGRLVELDIEYGDGSTERRLLNRDTDSYVLPDLPDDVPLPPEPAPSPSTAGPLSLAGHDYARSLGKLDDQIREYMSITASTEVTAKTFKNRDAAARALTDAFDRTVGGVLAERSHENLRYPTGLHGRALPPEATGVDWTLLRSRYATLLAERLPDAGPVSREQLIDAAQQLHVRHDAAADMPYYEGIARTTLDKHPQGTLEHIIPGRLQPGDIIALGGDEYEVDAVTHRQSDMAVQVTLTPTGQGPNRGYRATSTEGLMSHDGGPSVVRLERGPASADQPWDAVMEPDGPPVRITGDQINIGDRLMVENRYNRGTIGMVVRLETATGDTANREVTIRMDGSRNTTLTISRGDHPGLFRLVEADGDIAERLRREQIERQRRRLTATISQTMATTVNNVHTAAAGRGMLGVGTSEWHTLHEIDQVDLQSIYRRNDPADTIIRVLGVTDPATRGEMRRRLDPIIRDLGIAARDRVRESVRLAKPLPGEDAADARRRVLRQISNQPPAVGEDFTAPAAALAALKEALDGTDTDGARILSDLPELGPVRDLRKRISAYQAALGDGANFGKARVRRSVMADTTLADLEAGKVPAVETVDLAVPDRAADGGPGEAAMRHLEIVRAAGKDLDAEVQRRMDAAGVAELEAQLPEARARADLRLADLIDMEDTMAREAGFQSLMDLRGAAARASDAAERQRLLDLSESIDARVMAEKEARWQRVDDLTRRIAAERRRAALAVLGEVREDGMGGVRIDWHDKSKAKGNKQLTERSELVKALRFAEDSYPRAWLERFRDYATKKGQVWKVGKIQRGHFQSQAKLINLSDESIRVEGAPKMGRVATHEMGHGMEEAIPGMLAAQNAFLWSRTSTGDIGSRTRQRKTEIFDGEYGYKDEFPGHYTGKDYVDRRTGEPFGFEVFTTGVESLMAGSNYLDDDFRQWVLGVMALLGTTGKDS